MVAYSFRPRFVAPIAVGAKRQTIRAHGKRRHARPGETLQLYTGMRTRSCKLIGTAVCIRRAPLLIDFPRQKVTLTEFGISPALDASGLQAFAVLDGFSDWPDLATFWAREHPGVEVFEGLLIRWGDLNR